MSRPVPRPGWFARRSIGVRSLFRAVADTARAVGRKMRWEGTGGQGFNWRQLLPGSQYDYEAAAGDLWRCSGVAACLRWIEVNFPEPKIEVVRDRRDGSEEVVPKSAVAKLLTRPNKHWDRFQFDAACALSWIVDGNCYIRKIRSASGAVVELWWIPHWLIWPRWSTDGEEYIGWYDYEVNGAREKIPVGDIIHWRQGIDPRDYRKGFSKVKTGVRSVCGLNECDTYTSAMLRNMGIVGAVISADSDDVAIDAGEIDILRDQWREDHTSEGRGTPLFAPRGLKVSKLGMSPEEMRLDRIPDRLAGTIHSLMGLSTMVTNSPAGKEQRTFANYGQSRKAAYEDCLIPMQKSFAECLTVNLLETDFAEGDRVRFDYSGIECLLENETEVAARVGGLYQVSQVITRAEAREATGYDWTDEDEVFFAEANPAPESGVDADGDPIEDEDEDAGELDGKKARGHEHRRPFFRDEGAPPRTPGTPPGDVDEPHADNTFRLPDGGPIRRDLKRWFRRQLATILGSVPEIGAPLPDSFPSIADYDDPMASAMTPMISGYWDEGGRTTLARLGLDPGAWQVHDPHLHQVIKDTTYEFCQGTNETTSKLLTTALDELKGRFQLGLVTQGDSIPELVKGIRGIFTELSQSKATTIARTEASRAVHGACLQSAKESGVVEGKKILLSSNACPLCHRIVADHPAGVGLDASFATVGSNPTYKDVKIPPLHPRCRCTVTLVLTPEYEDLLRDHGPPHFDTFAEGSLGPEPKPDRKVKRPAKAKAPKAEKPAVPPEPAPKPVPPPPRPIVVEPGQFAEHAHVDAWAKRTFPNASFRHADIPVENWNVLAKEMDALAKDYPRVAANLKRINPDDPKVVDWGGKFHSAAAGADSRGGSLIAFNPKYWSKPIGEITAERVRWGTDGFGPLGVHVPQATVTHEWGHLLDADLRKNEPDKHKAARAVFESSTGSGNFSRNRGGSVSQYAATNEQEAFAEAFLASRSQPPQYKNINVRRFAEAIGNP